MYWNQPYKWFLTIDEQINCKKVYSIYIKFENGNDSKRRGYHLWVNSKGTIAPGNRVDINHKKRSSYQTIVKNIFFPYLHILYYFTFVLCRSTTCIGRRCSWVKCTATGRKQESTVSESCISWETSSHVSQGI